MKTKILVNPYANRWGARRRIPDIHAACREAGLNYDLSEIPAAGQGKEAAMQAVADGYETVVAAGGDGTVSEVVNGLLSVDGDGPTVPLGVLPVGTGNDFSDMNGLPRDLVRASKAIAGGHTRQLDAGRVLADGRLHYFDNNCALAMEPLVTLENIRMKRLSGNIRYVVSVVKALIKLQAWHMDIGLDDETIQGQTYLLSVCNGPRTGGIFPMAPDAQVDDGLFDVVYAPEMAKAAVVAIVLKLFRGTHIRDRRIQYTRSSRLTIQSTPGTPIHADGELVTESASEIVYDILPGRITLLSPEPAPV